MEIYASKEDIGNIRADIAGLEGRLRADIKDQASALTNHANDDRRDIEAVNVRVDAIKGIVDNALGGMAVLKWMIVTLMGLSAAGTIKLFLK